MQPVNWPPFAFSFLGCAAHPANITTDVDFRSLLQFLYRLILFVIAICEYL